MDAIGTAINAGVVAAMGFILAWISKGRFEGIDHRFDRLEQRIDGLEARFDQRSDGLEARFDQRSDGLETRFDRRMDAMQGSIDAMRSDLTQVALAVGVRPRATNI